MEQFRREHRLQHEDESSKKINLSPVASSPSAATGATPRGRLASLDAYDSARAAATGLGEANVESAR